MLWILLSRSSINMSRKEKTEKKIINNLKGNVSRLTQKVDDLSEAVEKQEQHSRGNCSLLYGISEKK